MTGPTLADPVAEAERLLEHADEAGLTLRAIGGVAVWLRCPSLRSAEPRREFRDLDLAGDRREVTRLAGFFEAEGYEPAWRFNRLSGGERLLFHDPPNGRKLDVFLDRLEMCHLLPFRDRLAREPLTLPLADLLLSKLQIVELTDRDALDLAALLADHEPGDGALEVARVVEVCAGDWGWWRTATGTLRAVVERWEGASGTVAGPDPAVAAARARGLLQTLEAAPKSRRWKLRAAIGERMAWHREPEEAR